MKIAFIKGAWEDKLSYAYTQRFPCTPKLIQEDDCVRNSTNKEMRDGFDYTSLLTKEKYGKGTCLTATCSFESYGAPLLVFPQNVWRDDRGELRYGDYFEVVLYENGINVWKLYLADGIVKYHKIFASFFPVEAGIKHQLSVTLLERGMSIVFRNQRYYLRVEDLPSEVYAGITACENINRFYDLSVEKIDT